MKNKSIIAGWIISAVPVLFLLMSCGMKLARAPQAVEGFKAFGYPDNIIVPLGVIELVGALLFVIPRTSVLGAVLLTGYLGGATATHVLARQSVLAPVGIGFLVWLGLILRDAEVRKLLPCVSESSVARKLLVSGLVRRWCCSRRVP